MSFAYIELLERLGLWHNGAIETEMLMLRLIEEDYMYEIPPERRRLMQSGKNKGKYVHRYPYWYYSSHWGREMKREPKEFGSSKFGGNFIPQIPIMAIKRFTHEGDLVIDRFAGSGTTLDVAKLLNRRCIGVDIYPRRKEFVKEMPMDETPQLVIMHPPYADFAYVYGDKPYRFMERATYSEGRGLSIPPDEFLVEFKKILDEEITPCLADDGHVCLVMGDGWRDGEIYPLASRTAELFYKDYQIKHTAIKYIGQWTGRANRAIWEYRSLKSGWGVMEHEYIYIFKKRENNV